MGKSIEEVLFNRTVVRYRKDISPTLLMGVTIEVSDKNSISTNMSKCAQYVHDLSDETGSVEIPDPDRLKVDLEELRQFVKVVQNRRK